MTKRIGMLTPSSNTVVEPVSCAILRDVDVSVHFSRFPVTRINLTPAGRSQFELNPMIHAARLLADAQVDVVAWNGTSGAWLGLDHDARLCQEIQHATGIMPLTYLTAQLALFSFYGIQRIGLVTPYRQDVVMAITQRLRKHGISVVKEKHLGLEDNHSFAAVSADTLTGMLRDAMHDDVQALCIMCTNLAGAPLVEPLEQELGVRIFDSVAVVVWGCLQVLGFNGAISGYGRLLEENPQAIPYL